MVCSRGRSVVPRGFPVAGITGYGRLLARFPAIRRVVTRGSGGGIRFHGGARRGVVVEGALRGYGHFVPIVVTSRRRLVTIVRVLTGMASLVGLPIPRTPTSVRRDHVRGALCALYAEGSPLVHLDDRLGTVPRIRRGLRLAFGSAGGVLRAGRRGVAGAVARPVHGTAVPLAGARGGLSCKIG